MISRCALLIRDLRCEYRVNPLGLQETRPRLSWLLESVDPAARGCRQTAYQIQVVSPAEEPTDARTRLWDTGRLESDQTFQIEYVGPPLESAQECHWRVRVWDQDGLESAWSPWASWTMGLLKAGDWTAEWIETPDPLHFDRCSWVWHPDEPESHLKAKARTCLFQKTLTLESGARLARAAMVLAADDRFAVAVNGSIVSRSKQPVDNFRHGTVLELTPFLIAGKPNLLSVRVTNASDDSPAGVAGKVVIRYVDGRQHVHPMDKSWNANWVDEGDDQALGEVVNPAAFAFQVTHVGATNSFITPVQPWGVPDRNDALILPPPAMFRREFDLDSKPVRALLFITALGIVRPSLNGFPVHEDWFTPGWSDYTNRVYYNTYNVTALLTKRKNCIGLVLSDGWHSGYLAWGRTRNRYDSEPMVMAQLRLEYENGVIETIGTNSDWQVTTDGPWREADLLMGESYDARLEKDGWDRPGFEAKGWSAVALSPRPNIAVEGYPAEPVRAFERLFPVSSGEPKPGLFVYDLGQNMVGVVQVRVPGPAGTRIRLRFTEVLNDDGTLYLDALRGARSTDTYIKKSDAVEVWHPRFTFHGFRYVEVSGVAGKLPFDSVTGIVLHSAMERVGDVSTANILVNRLFQNILWGQKGNFLEVPTDCPQRDERLGWTGDAQIFNRTATFNFDVAAFFTKWMRDLFDAQAPDGWIDIVAPKISMAFTPVNCSAAWSDAAVICPWTLFRVYGDVRIIDKYYDGMCRYIEFLKSTSDGLIRPAEGFGDWVSLNAETPLDLLATAYFAYDAMLMAEMAGAIGRTEDAEGFRKLYLDIRTAFQAKYVDANGFVQGNTQTCYVLALRFHLLPENLRATAFANLVRDLAYRGGHFSTGFVGLKDIMPCLTEEGRSDLSYEILLNENFPGWGYEIRNGATTIWERWDGWNEELGLQTPQMNSFNHYSLGAVGEWMYRMMGGIDLLEPGYRRISIHPYPTAKFRNACVQYRSISGVIASFWFRDKNGFHLVVRIPPNTSARIHVPCDENAVIEEGAHPVAEVSGIHRAGRENGAELFDVQSGHYEFLVRN